MDFEQVKVILNRIPYLGVALAWGIWSYWGYYQFTTTDLTSPLIQKKNQVRLIQEQNQKTRKRIQEGETFKKTLAKKREELRALAIQLGEMKSTLSEELDVANLIKIVVTEAKRLRIRVNSLKPAAEKKQEFYSEQGFELEFRGLYAQMMAFMVRISNSQTILKIADLNFKPEGDQDGRFIPVNGRLRLVAYRYNGSKADEIAKTQEGTPNATQ